MSSIRSLRLDRCVPAFSYLVRVVPLMVNLKSLAIFDWGGWSIEDTPGVDHFELVETLPALEALYLSWSEFDVKTHTHNLVDTNKWRKHLKRLWVECIAEDPVSSWVQLKGWKQENEERDGVIFDLSAWENLEELAIQLVIHRGVMVSWHPIYN
ncbi:hypothetical protein ABW19_dt0208549 [Dactylella cylindrospora]|nr:hypothetical protein ABW19_dt0208549 [Dactylella cylindrospora]